MLVAFTEYNRNVIRLEPPLICQREHVDRFVDAMDKVLSRWRGGDRAGFREEPGQVAAAAQTKRKKPGFSPPGLWLEQIRLNPGHILQPRSSVGIPAA